MKQNSTIHHRIAVWKRVTSSQGFSLGLISLPFIIMVFAFYYLPMFGWVYSFVNYKPGIPLFNLESVGFKYFQQLFDSMFFGTVLRNTLVLSLLNLLVTPVPIVFAIMLSQVKNKRFMRLSQTISSFPNFVSWIIVYSLVFTFFSEGNGIINVTLMNMHIIEKPLQVLGNPQIAWYFQTLIGLWKSTGWTAIIYIAAISSIDEEMYDAAEIDGCGRFGKIRYVMIPGIMPTYVVMLVIQIGFILSNGFEQYYVFQNPIVMEKLNVLDTYVYYTGITQLRYSFATAVGMFKSVISIILVFLVNWMSKKVTGSSII